MSLEKHWCEYADVYAIMAITIVGLIAGTILILDNRQHDRQHEIQACETRGCDWVPVRRLRPRVS